MAERLPRGLPTSIALGLTAANWRWLITGGMNNPVGLAFSETGERFLSGTFFDLSQPEDVMEFYMRCTEERTAGKIRVCSLRIPTREVCCRYWRNWAPLHLRAW